MLDSRKLSVEAATWEDYILIEIFDMKCYNLQSWHGENVQCFFMNFNGERSKLKVYAFGAHLVP